MRMLAQGGNAVDAGVATVLAATVTEQSRVGLGGEIPILIKMKDKPVIAISGIGVAGSKATVEFFEHRTPEQWEQPGRIAPIPAIGPRAAITPGLVDGLLLALEKYGTMSFAQVAAPAIEYADEGFPIGEEFAEFLGELTAVSRLLAGFVPILLSQRRAAQARRDRQNARPGEYPAPDGGRRAEDQGRPRRQDPRRARSVL